MNEVNKGGETLPITKADRDLWKFILDAPYATCSRIDNLPDDTPELQEIARHRLQARTPLKGDAVAMCVDAAQIMRDFYVSKYYEPKSARPADNVQAAIEFTLERCVPEASALITSQRVEIEALVGALEYARGSILGQQIILKAMTGRESIQLETAVERIDAALTRSETPQIVEEK